MSLLLNPAFFDRLIIALFILAAIRWAIERNWMKSLYWMAAALLNVAVLRM